MNWSVRTKACASLAASALCVLSQSLCTYRLAAGYSPPSAFLEPSAVVMSTSGLASPMASRAEVVGSVVQATSTRFCFMAAISVVPAPTGSKE